MASTFSLTRTAHALLARNWNRLSILLSCLIELRGAVIASGVGICLLNSPQIQEYFKLASPSPSGVQVTSANGGDYGVIPVCISTVFIYLFARLSTLVSNREMTPIRENILVILPFIIAAVYLANWIELIMTNAGDVKLIPGNIKDAFEFILDNINFNLATFILFIHHNTVLSSVMELLSSVMELLSTIYLDMMSIMLFHTFSFCIALASICLVFFTFIIADRYVIPKFDRYLVGRFFPQVVERYGTARFERNDKSSFGGALESSSSPIIADAYIPRIRRLAMWIVVWALHAAGITLAWVWTRTLSLAGERNFGPLATRYGHSQPDRSRQENASLKTSIESAVGSNTPTISTIEMTRPAEEVHVISRIKLARDSQSGQITRSNLEILALQVHASLVFVEVIVLVPFAIVAFVTFIFVTPIVFLLSFFSIEPYSTSLSQILGSIAIIQIFVILLMVIIDTTLAKPVIVALIVLFVVLFSYFDLNDNHHIATLQGQPAPIRSTLGGAFREWYKARKDSGKFLRYPVYVVAARGGGIYAAYHTAMFLARLQDYCPSFSQHVFAISSVSGGSLGAATFAALTQGMEQSDAHSKRIERYSSTEKKTRSFSARARALLSADFLSPMISALLFSDMIKEALPTCFKPLWCWRGADRARALEASFEQSFSNVVGADRDNPFRKSVYSLWTLNGANPVLLINTTEVETGERVVIAPFRELRSSEAQSGQRVPHAYTLLDRAPDLDLRLSTAVGISARFPAISPAASYDFGRGDAGPQKRRLVDGGYYDNSGIVTALDAIGAIVEEAEKNHLPINIRLLVLSGVPHDEAPTYAFSEILSPINALFNVRDEQGRLTEQFALDRLEPRKSGIGLSALFAGLDASGLGLPLGWRLSERTRNTIEAQIGTPACSSCAMEQIYQDLRNGTVPTGH